MARIVFLWIAFVYITVPHFYTQSLQHPCFKNQDSFGCTWNPSISSCICDTNDSINMIYIINNEIDAKFNWRTITSVLQTKSNQIILRNEESFNFVIDQALVLFSSYGTNYGEITNILVVFDAILSPATKTKLETHDIQTIIAPSSHNEQHIISFISCQIHQYQHHLSLQQQKRVLLQSTNTDTTCCKCVDITSTKGCPADKICEERVCDTDRICCESANNEQNTAIGWDESCVHIAATICTENTVTINNPQTERNTDIIPQDTCWEIGSYTECNAHNTEYGCLWSALDEECMCNMNGNNIGINAIYLVDISLFAMPANTDYYDIAQIIDDVTALNYVTIDSHSLLILYDENVYIQNMDTNATNVDISPIERTQTNNLLYAIDTALNHFILFNNNNPRILIIFNGQTQSHYADDPSTVCAKRGELERNQISVIINSYLVHNTLDAIRDLQCLLTTNEGYNHIPYIAIHGASTRNGWEGFPVKAKLSWDVCEATLHSVDTTAIPQLVITEAHALQNAEPVINEVELQTNVPLRIEGIQVTSAAVLEATLSDKVVSSPTKATDTNSEGINIPVGPYRVPTRYIYKPRITPPPLCSEPREICSSAQIFNERICECQCPQAAPEICADLTIFNPISCECEVFQTLSSSDLFHTETRCEYDGDLDVLFVVDSSCGLDERSCSNKGEFVSHLVQIIMENDKHRVGVLQCGETFGYQYVIPLEDEIFGEINRDLNLDRLDAFDLYFNIIQSSLRCASGSTVPKSECLQEAVSIFSDEELSQRVHKIVFVEICGANEGEEPCETERDWMYDINANYIEIVLVHIGDAFIEYNNECLLRNGAESIYEFDNFDFNLLQNILMTHELVDGICSSPVFDVAVEDDLLFTTQKPSVEIQHIGVVSNNDIIEIQQVENVAIGTIDDDHENGNIINGINDIDRNINEDLDSNQNTKQNAKVRTRNDNGNTVRRVNPVRARVVNFGSDSGSDSSSD